MNLTGEYSIYLGYDYSTDKKIFVYNFLTDNNKPLSHEWRNYFTKDQYQKDTRNIKRKTKNI